MVLADREHVEAELVGELRLLEQLRHALLRGDVGVEVGEGGESEFQWAVTVVVDTTVPATVQARLSPAFVSRNESRPVTGGENMRPVSRGAL